MIQDAIQEEGEFRYIETGGNGYPIVLLHGLMGALSNFESIVGGFRHHYNVVVPLLPIYDMPSKKLGLSGLVEYVENFIDFKNYDRCHLLGNSLGGHIAQLYALKRPDKCASITLTGSSGLFENAMGSSFPRRGSYEYIKAKTEMVFYDPAVATKELVDEVYNTVSDLSKAIRIVKTAKSAIRHNLEDKLHMIETPVLLVWGKQDEVTPAWVGEKFHDLLPNSELYMFDECGHAPMMEKKEEFNKIFSEFLEKHHNVIVQEA
jgi:2-hydroxy-6-oxonona-2,4-dienedioate hydrolase